MTDQQTIRVRIAVAVTADGKYEAVGAEWHKDDQSEKFARDKLDSDQHAVVHWIEADVPLPVSETIEGEVVE